MQRLNFLSIESMGWCNQSPFHIQFDTDNVTHGAVTLAVTIMAFDKFRLFSMSASDVLLIEIDRHIFFLVRDVYQFSDIKNKTICFIPAQYANQGGCVERV